MFSLLEFLTTNPPSLACRVDIMMTNTHTHTEPKITSGQRSISVQTTRRTDQRQCHADNMSGHVAVPAYVHVCTYVQSYLDNIAL